MPKDITNTEDYESTPQRRVLGRIFERVDFESDNIEEITEYRTGRITVTFGGERGVRYLDLR